MKHVPGKRNAISALALAVSLTAINATLVIHSPATAEDQERKYAKNISTINIKPDCADVNLSLCKSNKEIKAEEFSEMVAIMEAARKKALTNSTINLTTLPSLPSFGILGETTGSNGPVQQVWLNFDGPATFGVEIVNSAGNRVRVDQFNAHNYTTTERNTIQSRMEADYANFNFSFTQTRPNSGTFATLNFFCDDTTPCISFNEDTGAIPSILFGRAEGIDVLNADRGDTAFADANFWEFVAQGFGASQLASFTGLPVTNSNLQQQLSIAVVNQASNTGAHELGHNLGFRHHDSFGAIGDGLPNTGQPAPSSFTPSYTGPTNASETVWHTMASGASAGLDLEGSSNRNRFFGERSIRKLSLNENPNVLTTEAAIRGSNNNRNVTLTPLNDFGATVSSGINAGRDLNIEQIAINGSISSTGQRDLYQFTGRAGDVISIEVNSFDIPISNNTVLTSVELFRLTSPTRGTLVARNEAGFEGFDPFLVDAVLPRNAEYVVRISSPNIIQVGGSDFDLTATGNGALRTGDYQANIYRITAQ